MSDPFYRAQLDLEAFSIEPLFPIEPKLHAERITHEERLLLEFSCRPNGTYYHAQDRVWRISFGGTDRFETFPLDQFAAADLLYRKLKAEGDVK